MHTTANSFLILLLALSLSTLSISLANASSLTSRKKQRYLPENSKLRNIKRPSGFPDGG